MYKVPGTENPADLMTKVLSISDIVDRLKGMNIEYIKRVQITPALYETSVSADTVNVDPNSEDRGLGEVDMEET